MGGGGGGGEGKMTKLQFGGGGLAESDLDLGGKMRKLQFVGGRWGWQNAIFLEGGGVDRMQFVCGKGWQNAIFLGGLAECNLCVGGGEVGGIRLRLGRKNEKVAICGGGGWQNAIFLGGGGVDRMQFVCGRGWQNAIFFGGGWQNAICVWGGGEVGGIRLGLGRKNEKVAICGGGGGGGGG